MLLKVLSVIIFVLFTYTQYAVAQGSSPVGGSSFDAKLYSSSLSFSKNMQYAVAVQDPHKGVYIYSLKNKPRSLAIMNGFISPRTVIFDEVQNNRFYLIDSTRGAVFVVDISGEKYTITKTIPVEKGIFGMVLDAKKKRLFVSNPSKGMLYSIDVEKGAVIRSASGFKEVQQGLALSQNGNILYAASYTSKEIYVVDSTTLKTQNTIGTTSGITNLELNVAGARLYATSIIGNVLSAYSTATNKLIATIPVGSAPMGITVPMDNSTLITSNIEDSSLSVISSFNMHVTRTIKLPTLIAGPIVASANKNSADVVYVLDKNMNILIVNWPMGLVEGTIE